MNFLRPFVWLILILFIGLGTTIVLADKLARANLHTVQPVLVRDSIGVGSHTLSGVIPVSSTCEEVILKTELVSSSTYALIFTTWREPHVPVCIEGAVTREFHAVVFGSSIGTSFTATLNGEAIPIAVIPEIPLYTAPSRLQ